MHGGDQLNDKCENNREGIEPLLKSLHKRNTEYYITFCTPYEIWDNIPSQSDFLKTFLDVLRHVENHD